MIVTQWTRINGTDGSTGCWLTSKSALGVRIQGGGLQREKKKEHTVESRNSNLKLFFSPGRLSQIFSFFLFGNGDEGEKSLKKEKTENLYEV